jgi:hypothetical protein
VLNVIPGIGQAKGIAEAIVGCDIVTGEELGVWRWAGLVGLRELRLGAGAGRLWRGGRINWFAKEQGGGWIGRSSPANYYSYKELKRLIEQKGLSGSGTGLEAHHLLQKVFASKLGLNADDIISVALTPQWHRNVGGGGINLNDTIMRELRGQGATPASATIDQIWQAHRNTYTRLGQEHWAQAIYDAYFKSRGVSYR